MKDFNIAKYLKENSLGSHSILGAYVDLHALKEEEVGNNKPVDEVPYVGAEEKLDGFGDEFDQVDPVEEMDNSVTGDKGWQYDDEDFSSERDKLDRMMGLAHEYFEKVSPIVKKTIDALRADGFDDQDIIDFLATDFTLEEEVSVSSSGVEMQEALSYEDLENDLNKIAIKMRKIATLTHNNAGDFTFVNISADDDDDPAYNRKVQNAGYKEVVNLINKKYPTLKVIEKEQNLDKMSFVIARK